MSARLYHNPRCSKSRQALALLQDNGIAMTVVEYLTTPPTAAELTEILRMLGLPAQALLRRKEAAEEGIEPALPEPELIAAMVAHPRVIERPIFINDGKARLGRPPEQVLEIV